MYDRWTTEYHSGRFTSREDTVIMAWVEKYGPTNWKGLALKLGRYYPGAGASIHKRYKTLLNQTNGLKRGRYELTEVAIVVKLLIQNDPAALDGDTTVLNQALKGVAAKVNRSPESLYGMVTTTISPTIGRFKAGTLEKDCRDDLVRRVRQTGWVFHIQINFKMLAGEPEFAGHTKTSLAKMWVGLRNVAIKRHPTLICRKEVTSEQVEGYWKSSYRRPKLKRTVEKEQCIVNAYLQCSQSNIRAEPHSLPHDSKISTEVTPTDKDELVTTKSSGAFTDALLQYSKSTIRTEPISRPYDCKTSIENTTTNEDGMDTTFIDNMLEAYLNHTKSNDLVNKVRIADVYSHNS